jgi:hypothetical protein
MTIFTIKNKNKRIRDKSFFASQNFLLLLCLPHHLRRVNSGIPPTSQFPARLEQWPLPKTSLVIFFWLNVLFSSAVVPPAVSPPLPISMYVFMKKNRPKS